MENQRFTLKDYEKNEAFNLHTLNALQLVQQFGTEEEIHKIKGYAHLHEKQGFLTPQQSRETYEVSNKYYKLLKLGS